MIEITTLLHAVRQDPFNGSGVFGCRLNKSVYSHKALLVLVRRDSFVQNDNDKNGFN
jgi:hypothetical protein